MLRAHLFCRVVDNFGDAGIAWGLARGLIDQAQMDVTLFIDDIQTLAILAPDYAKIPGLQVENEASAAGWVGPPADIVIEILAGTAPLPYQQRAAAQINPPTWVIYEYLSAEAWVKSCHLKPSPHPTLNLPRFYFYPGFTDKTGGLLYDPQIFDICDPLTRAARQPLTIGLFCYQNPSIPSLLDAFQTTPRNLDVHVPQGVVTRQIKDYLAANPARTHPQIHLDPFVPKEKFPEYIAGKDINFVRGEDSLTTAVILGTPVIWHIYPQDDAAHFTKLQAFCDLFTTGLTDAAARAFTTMNFSWNGRGNVGPAWSTYLQFLPDITAQARVFAQNCRAHGSAIKNLVDFCRKVG